MYQATVRPAPSGRARRPRPPNRSLRSLRSATFAGGVRILSVVGNRPQFVKSGPLSLALARAGREEVVLHTGQHYDRELSEIFFDELGLAPPAYRLEAGSGTHARADGPDAAGHRGGGARGAAGRGARLRRHELDARRRARGGQARRAGGARRGRAALVRPHDARGAEPDGRRPALDAALLSRARSPSRNLAAEAITEGVHVVGDVMLDANLRLAPLARERSQALAEPGSSPAATSLLTLHREANSQPSRSRGSPRRSTSSTSRSSSRPIRARCAALAATGIELPPQRRVAAAGRLPRLRGARVAGACRPHGLGGRPEGGVLVRRPVRDAADDHGVGRDRRERVEPPRRRRPRLDRRGRARGRARAEHPPLYGDGEAAERIADLLCTMRRDERELAIIGAGYVGVPLAQVFAEAGVGTVLVDVDADRVAAINRGESYIEDVPRESLRPARRGGNARRDDRLRRGARGRRDPHRASHSALRNREPDLSIVLGAAASSPSGCGAGQLVVLESTTYPGTTREEVLPILGDERPRGRQGLPPRLLARARRSGPHRLDDEEHAEDRRRPHARLHGARPARSTGARSTRSSRCPLRTPPSW